MVIDSSVKILFYYFMPKLKTINPELLKAVQELYHWQYENNERSPSFSYLLYLMFQKADATNLVKLRKGFPEHYLAWKMWKDSPSQDEFFENWLGDEFNGVNL